MLRSLRLLLILLPVVSLSACRGPGARAVPSRVSPASCMATAEAYRLLRWMGHAENVRHGLDPDGIRVDTPDVSWQKPGAVPGWWKPGQWNTGMPYQWGGFASPQEFLRDIAAGKAAGDVYTSEKRRLLEAAVSRHATGIDCSGFISRCWGLSRPYSTRELPSLCDALASWEELQPGDILNTWNAHVILFAGWADASRTTIRTIETGRPPHWLVTTHTVAVRKLRAEGFTPMRYRGMTK